MTNSIDKNIMLLFMSPLSKGKDGGVKETKYVSAFSENEDGPEVTIQTNESAVKLLSRALPQKKFDKIFAFASQKIRTEKVVYKGVEKTHLEHFRERIAGCLPTENDLVVYDYDENKDVDASLQEMVGMAGKIMEYKRGVHGGKVVLHADMTGGMRNASMVMLGVMRFLEYGKIKLGRVLYSDINKGRVEDAVDVYRFFDLVVGARDFANYGTIQEIDGKFNGRKVSEELRTLLDAMHNFSDQVKLCFYGAFRNSIDELDLRIKRFQEKKNKDFNDLVFESMLPTIMEEYEKLFAKDDLNYIEWCIEHGYYQQALTLYTERVPEYIFEKGILKQIDENNLPDNFISARKERPYLSFSYWVLADNECGSGSLFKPTLSVEKTRKYIANKVIYKLYSEHKKTMIISKEQIVTELQECQKRTFCRLKFDAVKVAEEMVKLLTIGNCEESDMQEYYKNSEVVQRIKSARCEGQEYHGDNGLKPVSILLRDIVKYCFNNALPASGREKDLLWIFGIEVEHDTSNEIAVKLCNGLCKLKQGGYIDTGGEINDDYWMRMWKIVCDYTIIRHDMRNVTNHAHEDLEHCYSVNEIACAVREGIQRLREEAKIVEQRRIAAKN